MGYPTTKKVRQTMLRFLLGCGHPNALLPNWGEIGGRGTEKFTKKKTGAPSRRSSLPDAEPEHVSDEEDRRRLRDGYRKHKRKRVSIHLAYLRTMEEYWPGNEAILHRSQRKYFLLPASQRPTEAAFRWAARSLRSASRINMGELVHRAVRRALMGSRADGVVAVGQLGVIDCTSEDQTLVSAVNSLKVLPSSNRTLVVDVKSEYILGIYCGFEFPSTLTSLLAILNCAADKVSFCAQHGVYISVGDWHSRVPKRIRADNGELKSEKGIKTMTASEVGLEFVRSYAGDMKSLVEATHLSMHRRVDHNVAGSTQGRAKERGEPAREEEACRTFEQNMKYVIEAVLYINNEQPVPQLLTVEMRKDGVQPTRRAIYEWYVDTVGAMQSDQESRDAFFHSSNQAANKAAKAVKAKALEDAGERKSSRSPGYEKRKNLDEEMNRQQLIKLGLGDSDAPGQTTLPHKPPDIRASQFPVLEQHTLIPTGGDAIGGAPRSSVRGAVRSVTADLMDQLRKTRRA